MAEEPRKERSRRPAREIPWNRRAEARMYLYPMMLFGVVATDSVSSIPELVQYRRAEMERCQREALRLGIEDCEDLLNDLRLCAEYDPEGQHPPGTLETLRRHIRESAECLNEELKAMYAVWKIWMALQKKTEADLEEMERTCSGLTPAEALAFADQYLLGYRRQTEPSSQSETNHPGIQGTSHPLRMDQWLGCGTDHHTESGDAAQGPGSQAYQGDRRS